MAPGSVLTRLLHQRAAPLGDLEAPALVVAPHYDDEVIGCGGTLALKRRAGAKIGVVWVSDSSTSHPQVPAADLTARRKAESLAGLAALGIPTEHTWHLGAPCDRVATQHERLVGELAAIIAEFRPAEVYTPCTTDYHPDHQATTRIAQEALRRSGVAARLYGYPVWLFYVWPWVRPSGPFNLLLGLKTVWFSLRELRLKRPVAEAVAVKRVALGEHKTQMEKQSEGWAVLGDVANGAFLKLFFEPYELFQPINEAARQRAKSTPAPAPQTPAMSPTETRR